MGKIPVVQRTQKAPRGQASPTVAPNTEYGRAVQALGGQLTRQGERYRRLDAQAKDIEQKRQRTLANIQMTQASGEAVARLAEEKDPKNYQSHVEKMMTDIDAITAGIEDEEIRKDMELTALDLKNRTNLSMQSDIISRQAQMIEDNKDVSRDTAVRFANTTTNPAVLASWREAAIVNATDYAGSAFDDPATGKQFVENFTAELDEDMKMGYVRNFIQDGNLDDAAQLVEDDESLGVESKKKLQEEIKAAKSKAEYDFEVATKQAQNDATSQLNQLYNAGELTPAGVEAMAASNPIIGDPNNKSTIAGKFRQLALSNPDAIADYTPQAYNDLIKTLFNIKSQRKEEALKINIDKLKPEEFDSVLRLQLQFVDAQINGLMNEDEINSMNLLFDQAIQNNPKFISKFGNYSRLVETITEWATLTAGTIEGITLQTGVVGEDNQSMVSEVFNEVMDLATRKGNLWEVGNDAVLDILNSVIRKKDEQIAVGLYGDRISAPDEKGVRKIRHGDSMYTIKGYSHGQPVVDLRELDANNTG